MSKATIVVKKISAAPRKKLDLIPKLVIEFSDGSTTKLFTYNPSRILRSAKAFVGLTLQEAHVLFHKKDSK